MPLIELEHIVKYYGNGENRVLALDDISLTVDSGEFVAIAGASGSGKSTLMNMLGCLDVQSGGDYRLKGRSVKNLDENQLSRIRSREIGFIFQGFNLVPGLTAAENVELPLIYRGVSRSLRRELVEKAMEKVSLSHRMSHRPCEMSGGQQQRVAIARAIAASPPIILADEPTGSLDSVSGSEVMEILHGLNRSGKTVIIITHDEKIAENAQRILRISDGRLVS